MLLPWCATFSLHDISLHRNIRLKTWHAVYLVILWLKAVLWWGFVGAIKCQKTKQKKKNSLLMYFSTVISSYNCFSASDFGLFSIVFYWQNGNKNVDLRWKKQEVFHSFGTFSLILSGFQHFFFPVSKPYIATIHRVMIIPPPASQVRESVGSLTGRHSAPQA